MFTTVISWLFQNPSSTTHAASVTYLSRLSLRKKLTSARTVNPAKTAKSTACERTVAVHVGVCSSSSLNCQALPPDVVAGADDVDGAACACNGARPNAHTLSTQKSSAASQRIIGMAEEEATDGRRGARCS